MPADLTIVPIAKKRGRPPGSRNRPKPPLSRLPEGTIQPAALRIEQAAQYLNVSVSTVRRLIRNGRLPSVSLGTVKLVTVRNCDRLLEGGA
jgi:excisionase family DNA binding protein